MNACRRRELEVRLLKFRASYPAVVPCFLKAYVGVKPQSSSPVQYSTPESSPPVQSTKFILPYLVPQNLETITLLTNYTRNPASDPSHKWWGDHAKLPWIIQGKINRTFWRDQQLNWPKLILYKSQLSKI
jgi:hypothetical protein